MSRTSLEKFLMTGEDLRRAATEAALEVAVLDDGNLRQRRAEGRRVSHVNLCPDGGERIGDHGDRRPLQQVLAVGRNQEGGLLVLALMGNLYGGFEQTGDR